SKVPKGQVTSYKAIGDFLGSGPRAVGQALRVNPFMPLPVPCHRVITSGLTIGGFSGATGDSQLVCNKRSKLTREGCLFDGDEFIANSDGKRKLFEEFIKGGI
ncbi:6-O-methylguanine DNA methyltransferase, partial [Phycomyces nitens]